MTLEEFKQHAQEVGDWAPGWDAIEECFAKQYPGQEPQHFGTNMVSRAMFGGDQYLDGYSVYDSPKGYKHIVTYGMSELYTDEEAFGGEYSKWGYEMTIKLAENDTEHCMWAINMMANLARYTYTEKRFFEPYQYVAGSGKSLNWDRESAITALIIVPDTEIPGVDTLYGRLDFVQLVGITEPDLQALMADKELAKVLVERMRGDNPMLVTDLNRTNSYL